MNADQFAQAQLAVSRGQLEAAWAAVTATWVSTMLSGLVIGSAFVTIALQRWLDQRKAERRRQYNNLSVLVEAMFAINYIEFSYEYLGDAIANDRSVSKYPIIFQLKGNARSLELTSGDREVGPGPTGVASRVVTIAHCVVERMTAISRAELFTPGEMAEGRAFIAGIRPDLDWVWQALAHQHEAVTSGDEGRWAEAEFRRRSRTEDGGRNVIEMLKAGGYDRARSAGLVGAGPSTTA